MRHNILFTTLSFIILTVSLILSWMIIFVLLALLLPIVLGSTDSEGQYLTGLMSFGFSFYLVPLGLIPAYFLSMRSAVYLREKRGWEIKYPRRLFVVSLAIPIIIFTLLSTFARNP